MKTEKSMTERTASARDPQYVCEWCEASDIPANEPERCRIMLCPKHGDCWHWPKVTHAWILRTKASEVVEQTEAWYRYETIRRAVLAWLPTCPTCKGTSINGHGIDDMGIRYPISCPTCGPLRAAVGVK